MLGVILNMLQNKKILLKQKFYLICINKYLWYKDIMNRDFIKKYVIGDLSVWRFIRSIFIIYLCVIIFGWFRSDSLLFQPPSPSYRNSSDIIQLNDGIAAVYLKNPTAKYTILYNHANAVDLGEILFFMKTYKEKGFSVFSYDYPGYGISPGKPSTKGACSAADSAIKWLINHNIPAENIIIHGRSVGGGPAVYLARKWSIRGLILESSFVSAFRVITYFPISPIDRFNNIAGLKKINCPVLVIHGKEDKTIPIWHGKKLYKAANPPKMCCWLDNTTHNYMPLDAEKEYWNSILYFVSTYLKITDNTF